MMNAEIFYSVFQKTLVSVSAVIPQGLKSRILLFTFSPAKAVHLL
jgi:hypothetical protein